MKRTIKPRKEKIINLRKQGEVRNRKETVGRKDRMRNGRTNRWYRRK